MKRSQIHKMYKCNKLLWLICVLRPLGSLLSLLGFCAGGISGKIWHKDRNNKYTAFYKTCIRI